MNICNPVDITLEFKCVSSMFATGAQIPETKKKKKKEGGAGGADSITSGTPNLPEVDDCGSGLLYFFCEMLSLWSVSIASARSIECGLEMEASLRSCSLHVPGQNNCRNEGNGSGAVNMANEIAT